MRKGDLTREKIIAEAAVLFNTRGYTGASLADLMAVTGLKKGGIYNHFQNKEEILLEAFDYAINRVNAVVREVIKAEYTAPDKLKAVVNFYRQYALNPIVGGGCPILNSVVQADETNPELQARVQLAYRNWVQGLSAIIERGIRRNEFRATTDVEGVAIFIISTIEGSIAMTRSFQQAQYSDAVADQLVRFIEQDLMV